MNLEERKNNTYFDKKGKQILEGDLLKVFHFKSGRRKFYMYHVVVIEQNDDFPVMACKSHYSDKPHYRLYVVADNEQRIFKAAEIISEKDFESERLKIKIDK